MERPHREGAEGLRRFPVRGLPLRTDAHGGKVQSGPGTRDGATAGGIIQQVTLSTVNRRTDGAHLTPF